MKVDCVTALVSRAVEPEPGAGAGCQEILDRWSRSQKFLDGGAGA